MHDLDDRGRQILRLRFEEDMTQHEIATALDISQMHVSRLLRRALVTLRRNASAEVPA
jgi:RNA polymerase sigma-B factor